MNNYRVYLTVVFGMVIIWDSDWENGMLFMVPMLLKKKFMWVGESNIFLVLAWLNLSLRQLKSTKVTDFVLQGLLPV